MGRLFTYSLNSISINILKIYNSVYRLIIIFTMKIYLSQCKYRDFFNKLNIKCRIYFK
nr:MAG TPA: hypothetical protein [Caudoviricetes sp.]